MWLFFNVTHTRETLKELFEQDSLSKANPRSNQRSVSFHNDLYHVSLKQKRIDNIDTKWNHKKSQKAGNEERKLLFRRSLRESAQY